MTELQWLDSRTVQAIHATHIARHGGRPDIRDVQQLELMLVNSMSRRRVARATLYELGSSYACAIVLQRPFLQGNERTAMLAAFTFLELNGIRVLATEEDAAVAFLGLAAGQVTEREMSRWLERNCAEVEMQHPPKQ